MNETTALEILNQIKEFYNKASESFSSTRQRIWPEFEVLIKKLLKDKEKVLDFGCGNGRFSEIFKKTQYIGVDISSKLIDMAQKKYPRKKFLVIDGLNLPFKDNFFDLVIAIAVFHHIPSKELRIKVLKEIKRVLKNNGILFLSVWYLLDKPHIWKLILKLAFKKIFKKDKTDFFDVYLPWQNKYLRYFHLFSKRSLKKEIQKSGFSIEKIFVLKRSNQKNLITIAKNQNSLI